MCLLRALAHFPALETFLLRTSLGELQPDTPRTFALRAALPETLRTLQLLVSGHSPLSLALAESLPPFLERLTLLQLTPAMIRALPHLPRLTRLHTGGKVDAVSLQASRSGVFCWPLTL